MAALSKLRYTLGLNPFRQHGLRVRQINVENIGIPNGPAFNCDIASHERRQICGLTGLLTIEETRCHLPQAPETLSAR
jgi:hypothetical protein